ncbi:MAG: 3'-5' exonuclease [Saprospiraceae bacterium]|nr:3'-5' exonuclease [Saprospiraceae bacterium]
MYLFFDVETIGFPKKWNRPHTDTFNWPRMVSIAWILYDKDRKEVEKASHIVKPEGFEIPYESERIHKITTEKAREEGVDLKPVLKAFAEVIDKAEYIVAHNLNFDENVVGAELYRKSIEHRLLSAERYCTMREGTYFCRLPGRDGRFKWPTLQELHFKLFGEKFKNGHDPLVDAEICAKCFFKLVDMEEIDLF